MLQASDGSEPVYWFINEGYLGQTHGPGLKWKRAPGDYRIVAVTARGKADSVNVLIR
jgi:membrane carboxypeptidase/penicillin-binding protein PbpC